ncbi:unnamed protein product [Owenia fusiformis]|uniref:Uncharacterized protein n=1 Tax=Owenia fusiformis TaxID=6347 RepID=A0A8J1UQM5_OWEFU|nr:unnamed protein product [Owenia fusiformis]
MAAYNDDFITGELFEAIFDDFESGEIDLNELYEDDKTESDAELFQCSKCSKKYKKKTSLVKHIQKKHQNRNENEIENEIPVPKPLERDIIGQRPAVDIKTSRAQAGSILKSTFLQLANDNLSNAFPPESSGGRANEAASKICSASANPANQETFDNFGTRLYDAMSDVIVSGSTKKLDSSMKYTMLQNFHQTQIDIELNKEFNHFYQSLGVNYSGKLLSANVKWTYFIKLCDILTPSQSANTVPEIDSSITKEEESTLRYVAGFIPFSLMKRYRRFKGEKFGLYVLCLQNWRANDDDIEGESLQDYTKAWTTTINRGGLFKVSDAVYSFFYKLECVVRQQLNIETVMADISVNLKKKLHLDISCSDSVKFAWEDIRYELFHIVTAKFINLRADSFVKF